ncbi:hypothetical protein KY328_01135 [Candidatus Woesearchaeota archaeon]|nr:hypothetical protein [Candidatus Woesearchaeota archaeon]MBW3021501.1 hypothetical protein [Candidatus Woesearchaeota archaeon]
MSTIFLKFGVDYGKDVRFSRQINANEIKLTNDVLQGVQGNSVYKFHINISQQNIEIDRTGVKVDDVKRTFFSQSEAELKVEKPEVLYFSNNPAANRVTTTKSVEVDYVDYADIPTSGNYIEIVALDPALEGVKNELVRLFQNKNFKVNQKGADSVYVFLALSQRNLNLSQGLFSLDKNQEIIAKSRKLGALVLNQLSEKYDLRVNLKPVIGNSNLDNVNVGALLEFEQEFIKAKQFELPATIENGLDKYFAG